MPTPRRPLTLLSHLITWALVAFLLVRFAPHLAAFLGIETGARSTPAYTVRTLDGATLTADSLRGRVVLVNFWATWCPPCRVEMPALQSMAARHREAGLVVLGLSVDRGPADDVRRFLAERGIDYPVAIVGPEVERAFGGVRGYPTSFLVDRTGKVRHQALGPLAMLSFEPAVRRLLEE
jgi:thiol-disulfide isomerase/thioredoxin